MYLGQSWVHLFLVVKAIKAQKELLSIQLLDAVTSSVVFCHSNLAEMKERTKEI